MEISVTSISSTSSHFASTRAISTTSRSTTNSATNKNSISVLHFYNSRQFKWPNKHNSQISSPDSTPTDKTPTTLWGTNKETIRLWLINFNNFNSSEYECFCSYHPYYYLLTTNLFKDNHTKANFVILLCLYINDLLTPYFDNLLYTLFYVF